MLFRPIIRECHKYNASSAPHSGGSTLEQLRPQFLALHRQFVMMRRKIKLSLGLRIILAYCVVSSVLQFFSKYPAMGVTLYRWSDMA